MRNLVLTTSKVGLLALIGLQGLAETTTFTRLLVGLISFFFTLSLNVLALGDTLVHVEDGYLHFHGFFRCFELLLLCLDFLSLLLLTNACRLVSTRGEGTLLLKGFLTFDLGLLNLLLLLLNEGLLLFDKVGALVRLREVLPSLGSPLVSLSF